MRLDGYFKNNITKVNFIKMDAQGAEWSVFKGMPTLLDKNRDIKIVLEFWSGGLKKFGIEAKGFLELLLPYGFKLCWINEQKKKIESADIDELLKIYTIEKDNYTNLLCVRE